MNDEEELKWLRKKYERDQRFRVGANRGLYLTLPIYVLLSYLFPLDTVESRIGFYMLVIVLFGLGELSAHYGRFKHRYETWG